jgi:hypothetical protein
VGKKKLIVIWPYRFRDFDWQRFELDYLAPHVEIHVHELIDALTPEFGAAYANQSENPAVKRFASLKEWRNEFKKISEDAIVFNHVRPINLKSTLICATLRRSGASIVGFSTGGVPFSDFRLDPERRDLPKSLKKALHFFRRNLLLIFMPDKVVVGGTEEVDRVRRDYPRTTKRVLANSSDFSNSLCFSLSSDTSKLIAVYLDTGFPGFPRDEVIEKIVEQVDGQDWYPKLDKFFGFVERELKNKVEIAIHPKHFGRDHQPMFGGRASVGGKTPELVKNASLVIATNSTSISYAVAFAKPLILVTSNQIQNGRDQYKASLIANIATETGARIFNIDREYTEQDLREAMVIDHAKYESYKRKYLTSRTDGKPNYQVLLDEVIFAED